MNPVGRNEPCPCGSGRRYKDCHGSLRVAGKEPAVVGSHTKYEPADLRHGARLFEAGDFDGAEALARRALEVNPNDAEALFKRSQ